MLRIVGELHPIAQLRHMHAQASAYACTYDTPRSLMRRSLKLELGRKPTPLHDPPPAPSRHLTRCLRQPGGQGRLLLNGAKPADISKSGRVILPKSELTVRVRTVFDGTFGRAYAYWMERPWLGRAVGIAMWGRRPKAVLRQHAGGEGPTRWRSGRRRAMRRGRGLCRTERAPAAAVCGSSTYLQKCLCEHAGARIPLASTRSSLLRVMLRTFPSRAAPSTSSCPIGACTACLGRRPRSERSRDACGPAAASWVR